MHGLHAFDERTPQEEMEAFDELPWQLRELLNKCQLRASAIEFRDKLKAGASLQEALARFRFNMARIPFSFVKPITMKGKVL
jgi:hypothetical protein